MPNNLTYDNFVSIIKNADLIEKRYPNGNLNGTIYLLKHRSTTVHAAIYDEFRNKEYEEIPYLTLHNWYKKGQLTFYIEIQMQ